MSARETIYDLAADPEVQRGLKRMACVAPLPAHKTEDRRLRKYRPAAPRTPSQLLSVKPRIRRKLTEIECHLKALRQRRDRLGQMVGVAYGRLFALEGALAQAEQMITETRADLEALK